ncbi:MAG TPA: urease accessory protein UreE [Polyangiales bacterium]
MLEIRERVEPEGRERIELTLTLPFDSRQRSRLRVTLGDGTHAALALPRGSVLRGGDLLRLSDRRVLRVVAAEESVSTARSSAPRALARAAYHLGNRHVPVEIGEGFVRYLHDHVLDAMVRDLGLSVISEQTPFEPEGGAYSGGQRAHQHSHAHGAHAHHGHQHAHDD